MANHSRNEVSLSDDEPLSGLKARLRSQVAEELIGRRLKVWWPIDKTFYEGVIDSYDPIEKKHKVLYDDGEVETLNLKRERWELLLDDVLPHPELEEGVNVEKDDEPHECMSLGNRRKPVSKSAKKDTASFSKRSRDSKTGAK